MAKQRTFPAGNRKTAPKRRRTSKRRGPLATWVEASKKTLTANAEIIGVSVQHLSNLLHGHTKPSRETAVDIERATGGAVPVASWGK